MAMVRNRSVGSKVFNGINVVFFALIIVVCVLPVWHVICASFSDAGWVMNQTGLIWRIEKFNVNGYKLVFADSRIWTGYLNTLIYVFGTTALGMFLTVMAVVMFAVSNPIMRMFRREDAEVIRIGALALKMQCCLLPFQSYVIIGNMLTQSIGYSFRATLTAVSKQGLFFIPAILVLPRLFGVTGLQLAQPVADGCTFLLTQVIVGMLVKELREMNAKAQAEQA